MYSKVFKENSIAVDISPDHKNGTRNNRAAHPIGSSSHVSHNSPFKTDSSVQGGRSSSVRPSLTK